MGWGFVWLMVILKIPVAALLWLVWWSIRQTPEEADEGSQGGGGGGVHGPRPHRPRPPRRGPHAGPRPSAPSRVRVPPRRLTTPRV